MEQVILRFGSYYTVNYFIKVLIPKIPVHLPGDFFYTKNILCSDIVTIYNRTTERWNNIVNLYNSATEFWHGIVNFYKQITELWNGSVNFYKLTTELWNDIVNIYNMAIEL
jgi:hypothetical protein